MSNNLYDVIVIGGGIAGMSAALILGRARRRVLVLASGSPRNEPASNAHGFVTRDGTPPLELLRIAREELAAYPNVEVMAAEALDARAATAGFEVDLPHGETVAARKLVLATGVRDVLPEIEGLAELWGNGLYHCPYCHGWEVQDRPWALLGAPHLAKERAEFFAGWTSNLSFLANGDSEALDAASIAALAAMGVNVEARPIKRLAQEDGGVGIHFTNGGRLTTGAVFIAAPQVQRSPLAERLGCDIDYLEMLDTHFVKVDAATGETSVAGVYAAGDMTGPSQSLVLAAASGAQAAYALNRALAREGLNHPAAS